MDFIIADQNRIEQGFLLVPNTLDVENNGRDEVFDFEISLSASDAFYKGMQFGAFIFSPGTEYGGRLGYLKTSTQEEAAAWQGSTWRGMLETKIIQPEKGQDYLIVSGEANGIIRELIGDMAPLFWVPETDSGIVVSNYPFDRYTTVRKGIEKMLRKYGGRLYIHAEQGGENEPFCVVVECVKSRNYADEIEYSQDSDFNFSLENKRNGLNHVICLGAGELKDRQVLHLYADAEGNISKTQSLFGIDEIAGTYDYSSAESLEALEEYGLEYFRENMNRKSFEVEITDGTEYEIGDMISGRDLVTGMTISAPVVGKIFRLSDTGEESIEYILEVSE